MKIFYSWQFDLPAKTNKTFIKDALERAICKLNKEIEIEDAERQSATENQVKQKASLDHDTKNIMGIPDVASTILEKIELCDVFVADVSLTGTCDRSSKRFPNPNVMVELGYAMAKLGTSRIILVMNTSAGPPEALPFDLRGRRWPLVFCTDNKNLVSEKEELTHNLKAILRDYIVELAPQRSLELTWQVDHSGGESCLVWGIKNVSSVTAKNTAIRFYQSKTFSWRSLNSMNKYGGNIYSFKADNPNAQQAMIKSPIGHSLHPGDTDWVARYVPNRSADKDNLTVNVDLLADSVCDQQTMEISWSELAKFGF